MPAKVAEIEAKFQAAANDNDQYNALILMAVMFAQLLLDCICNALLVPCGDCDEEEGVLLACLTVRGNKIEKICNTVRKQLITGRSLHYWIQPFFSGFEAIFEWHVEHLEASCMVTREALLKRLAKRYNMTKAALIKRNITLPHSQSKVTVITHDFQAQVQSLLSDPRWKDSDYLFHNDDPTAPPPEEFTVLRDINTGKSYRDN